MAGSWQLKEEDGIVQLVFNVPGTEVNVLTTENMRELRDHLVRLKERSDVQAVLFTSAKERFFIAGADIKEINGISTVEDAFEKAHVGKLVFQLIEDLKVPTVAVINGACLGGGYELALACRFRTASTSDKVKIGLPEVNLGILPGFGGSIRLPRLLGLVKALPLILGGVMVSPKKAAKLGMVDRLFSEADLLSKSVSLARQAAEGKIKPAFRSLPARLFDKAVLGPFVVYPAARRDILKRGRGFYPAPMVLLDLIRETYGMDAARAFKKESEAFAGLAVTDVSKNLIHLFFVSEKYKKKPWTEIRDADVSVSQCGVVGAGVMGGGIAQLVSYRDIPVKVKDINQKALEGAAAEARRIYDGAVKRGKLSREDSDRKMKLIDTAPSEDAFARCDLVIEAVVEDLEIKKKVFADLDARLGARAILASNTSSLSVTRMAEACREKGRVVGLHFFNPVHRMPLVEVIRSAHTSPETLEKTIRFARNLGKTVIVVKDAPGFLVNRLLMPYMNEAAFMLEEGVPQETIDRAARRFGMPMGPIELADQVGIDVGYKVAHILEEAFGERMKTAAILETVKNQGFLGKKTGKGFYVYGEKKVHANPEVRIGREKSSLEGEEIIKRLMFIMINEAARCLEEGIVDSPETVDVGMIMGTGFPPFRGGLLKYADSVGIDSIAADLDRFQQDYLASGRFAPSPFLRKLAEKRKGFYDPV